MQTTDWRAATLAKVRAILGAADPEIIEESKWRGTPVFSRGGIVCTGETYKTAVKLTFAKGASLPDPSGLFNASLDGKTRRAIDIHKGEKINAPALKKLIRAAVALNLQTSKPKLLSGGNPQIAKADGDPPVQAYIDALPGWKRDVGRRLDSLIVRAVPGVRKAVKWNSPFYGAPGTEDWFLSFHAFTNFVKVAFFRGAALHPLPPGPSKQKDVRYLDIHQTDPTTDAQLTSWIRQSLGPMRQRGA